VSKTSPRHGFVAGKPLKTIGNGRKLAKFADHLNMIQMVGSLKPEQWRGSDSTMARIFGLWVTLGVTI